MIKLLTDIKIQILITTAIFSIGIICGMTDVFNANDQVMKEIQKKFAQIDQGGYLSIGVKLFINNSFAALLSFLCGVVFAVIPIIVAFTNGMIIGIFVPQLSLTKFICLILPHGIFEIPAIFIAIAIGIKVGLWPFQVNKWEYLKTQLNHGLMLSIKLILPLLLLASIIETVVLHFAKNYT
jgi:stage II sporulation protein M